MIRLFADFAQTVEYVFADALFYVVGFGFLETVSGYVLVEFDIAVGNRFYELRCHFGDGLTFFSHEIMVYKPLAHELFGELTLWLAFGEAFLVAVGIEVT